MYHLKPEPFEAFVTIPCAFQPYELDIISSMLTHPETAVVGNNEVNKDIRDSKVRWIHPGSMNWIFERISQIVNEVNPKHFGMELRATEALQLTEYDSSYSGFYGVHTDSGYENFPSRYRKLSITMQLSEPTEYEGGDLLLYWQSIKKPFMAAKERGTMTLFRSHILHEVTPVTSGTRRSLVTWVQGPLFK